MKYLLVTRNGDLLVEADKVNASVTLEANSYYLFTFHTDGSVFAHSDINPQVTGVKVTKKAQRVKLEK
jgi:hypothetical protein